jgi:hypothetical protein
MYSKHSDVKQGATGYEKRKGKEKKGEKKRGKKRERDYDTYYSIKSKECFSFFFLY